MKKIALFLITLTGVALSAPAARADGGPLGIGLELGVPTGLSLKYYMGKSSGGSVLAVQGGLGVIERYGDDGLHIHAEVLWHPRALASTPDFTLPFYLGVGARFLEHDDNYCVIRNEVRRCDDNDTRLGVRVPFGLLMDFTKVPFDLFLELAIVVDFLEIDEDDYEDDHDRVNLNLSLGGRYYF
jgi:hypothetical protein